MTDSLNKSFMDDPAAFLRDHPVDINPYLGSGIGTGINILSRGTDDPGHMAEGVAQFDLVLDTATGLVRLLRFADRVKAATKYTHRIDAYWLPWNPDGAASVPLTRLNNSGAEFLFTSSLAGCRILVTDTEFHHISGQLNQTERAELSDELRQGGRARAFSSSTGNTYGVGAFIVGYRAKTGIRRQRNGEWNFVAQRAKYRRGQKYTVRRVWQNNDLFLIDADE